MNQRKLSRSGLPFIPPLSLSLSYSLSLPPFLSQAYEFLAGRHLRLNLLEILPHFSVKKAACTLVVVVHTPSISIHKNDAFVDRQWTTQTLSFPSYFPHPFCYKYRKSPSFGITHSLLTTPCGAGGRVVASDTRYPQFESSHRQFFYLLSIVLNKMYEKTKNGREWPNFKTTPPADHLKIQIDEFAIYFL